MLAKTVRDTDRLWCWLDIETTGLDERNLDLVMLEIALVVTTSSLEVVAEAEWKLHHLLPYVDPLIWDMHGPCGSKLLQRRGNVIESKGEWWTEVEEQAVQFLHQTCPEPPLCCGRNVHFDRRWIRSRMPRLHDAFCHRSIDESSLRIAAEAWTGTTIPHVPCVHRAKLDLRQSIEVLRGIHTQWKSLHRQL